MILLPVIILLLIMFFVAPIYAFIEVSKIRPGMLRHMLLTVSTVLIFLGIGESLALIIPFFTDSLTISVMQSFSTAFQLIGDIFAIKAMLEFRHYSKLLSFKIRK